MVMKKKAMRKNLTQSILKSFGRYIAIVAIIALGASMFVGLLMTKTDMVATGQAYMDEQNMFDLRIVSSYGWDQDQLDAISGLPEIADAEGIIYLDAIAGLQGSGKDAVFRFYALPERVNRVMLRGGRMPQRPDECLIDGYIATDAILGTTITISSTNEDETLEAMVYDTYTIVGYVSTSLYMDMNRGTTSVGNGSLETYLFIPREGFDVDYYSEIHVTLPGDYAVYTDQYNEAMESAANRLEPQLEDLAEHRFRNVKADAMQLYHEGMVEYFRGVKEFHEGEEEANSKLKEGYQSLMDAEADIAEAEDQILRGERQIASGKRQLYEAQKELDAGKAQFEEQAVLYESLKGTMSGLRGERDSASGKVAATEGKIASVRARIENLSGNPSELGTRIQLELELVGLQAELSLYKQELAAIDVSISLLLPMEEQFVSAEEQIKSGQDQINRGWAQIIENERKLEEAKRELERGKQELADGWETYEEEKAKALEELEDARQKLRDAKLELEDALDLILDMDAPSLYILDRNSNVGYGSLDSSSDIVQGVSRVFPAFFLLVAALVCITTMTRMIDEERTQIGTLKALGYTNGEIISKYLIYAGSGAVLGCGLGVLVGSVVFPTILWQAYKIMLYITDGIVLRFNWWLCGIVVAAYTAVMLLVTWHCCRKALKEQPAELIRPKAPEAGKKIFLEYLPFWKRISFLNKVTIRNIFRYRQRFAMMMVGIGGCTALLLTGFGLRDSIINVVNYQFEEVTVYDLQVYFENGQSASDQEKFCKKAELDPENVLFYHQQSMELEFDNVTQVIFMMASGEDIRNFIDFHAGNKSLAMPEVNQVMLSSGVAEALGIRVGDRVRMRNADMQSLDLTVSAVYDNHVNNYAIVAPETIQTQWGAAPEKQMALVEAEERDVHELSAKITGMLDVMNVSVSADLASMVGNMMEALDLVVWVIVFCAGLLAAIVLYNLTNININERIREIATIKVLGFNAGETGAYVFKENLSLSAIGSVLGLGLGYLLLQFVMSQVKLNMVWFKAICMPVSYVLAVTLTMVAACIVDFVFYFRLEKINMAEALKSVE